MEQDGKHHPHHSLQPRSVPPRNIVTMMVSYGRELTLTQRIGYAMFSLFALAFGLFLLLVVSEAYKSEEVLTAFIRAIPSILCIVVGAAGLLNVLRFPRS